MGGLAKLADRGQKNWCFHARELLHSLMFNGNINPADTQGFIHAMSIKHQLAWLGRVWDNDSLTSESGGRLSIFRSLKFFPRTEKYLEEVLNPGHRRIMVQLRAGCLPLELETARYRSPRIPVSERVCKLCTLKEVEDKFHFVIWCPRLNELRNRFFLEIQKTEESLNFLLLNPLDKFLYIMSCNTNCSLICKFIYLMFMFRRSVLYI